VTPFAPLLIRPALSSVFAIARNSYTYAMHTPLLENSGIAVGKPSHHIGVTEIAGDVNGQRIHVE